MAILHCDGRECGTRTFGSDVTGHAYACRKRAFQQFVRSHARAGAQDCARYSVGRNVVRPFALP